jgi:predicted nucleic acid-binding protein
MRLLDTDVLIDLQRRHAPAVAWFGSLREVPSVPGVSATLCTFNVKHYRMVPGLVLEQPYAR